MFSLLIDMHLGGVIVHWLTRQLKCLKCRPNRAYRLSMNFNNKSTVSTGNQVIIYVRLFYAVFPFLFNVNELESTHGNDALALDADFVVVASIRRSRRPCCSSRVFVYLPPPLFVDKKRSSVAPLTKYSSPRKHQRISSMVDNSLALPLGLLS